MFYTEDKIIQYPNRSVISDVLSRSGKPSAESFTPYNGMAALIPSYFKDKTAIVDVETICASGDDYVASKARPSDDDEHVSAAEKTSYHTRLEDIDEESIKAYVKNILYGYKYHSKNSMRELDRELMDTQTFINAESGELTCESDLIKSYEGATTEEVLEAKSKLPYLLKQLHQGSIEYRGSLLSFIIAKEKFHANVKDSNAIPKPQQLVHLGVYRVNQSGDICGMFKETDNTGNIYRLLMEWVTGKIPDCTYWKAYKELMNVLGVLELDITLEDATQYKSDYIRKMVVTYLTTNEEFIETYGFVNKQILTMLSPDNLFKVRAAVASENGAPLKLNNQMKAEVSATNFLSFVEKRGIRENAKLVSRFLALFCKIKGQATVKKASDYGVRKSFLYKTDSDFYVVIDMKGIISREMFSTFVCISSTGHLVHIEDSQDIDCVYMELRPLCDYLESGGAYGGIEWKTTSV